SGLSFRHERYPAYKATREKLGEELQADFDRGMERIKSLLEAYNVPVISLAGYEADDVIGTMARLGVSAGLEVVVVSGDKDFQQLVRPGVRLLNPGRGGPAGVEEQWVTTENASERLGVPPDRVTDYLALVGDSSDNIPGVKGIGDKTAVELVATYGTLENILANAPTITKKRPREALLSQADVARLSKELVSIREDLPLSLDLSSLSISEPDHARLKELFVELEFHSLAKEHATAAPPRAQRTRYQTLDTVEALVELCARARAAPYVAVDTETVVDADSPLAVDALRSTLVGLAIAVAPGEAYYLPFRHRSRRPAQQELLPNDATVADAGAAAIRNLPPLTSDELAPLRALLEDPTVRKTVQNAKYDMLVLRRAGVMLAGVDFDTMIASYVLDPGRRSHGLDVLALEFLDHKMTTYEDLCGNGRNKVPYDECAVNAARDYSCEDADMMVRLRAV